MQRRVFIIGFLLFASLLVKKTRADERYVVLVSIDGLAASYFNDPRAPMPTLRKLAAAGARAEGMVTSFPSVTWPAHTTIITGANPAKHGMIGNSTLDRKTFKRIGYIGDPVFTKDECVKVPTLYDAAHKKGLKTAAIIWPATNGAKTLHFAIPDSNKQQIHDRYTTPGLVKELKAANISIDKLGAWGWDHKYSAMRDDVYTRAAGYLLRKHRPNLLLMHLITPDGFEHDYGPHVEEAYWACANADDRIRQLWEMLNAPPLKGKATLFVVSDHGFAHYDRLVNVNSFFKQQGLVETDAKGNVTGRHAWSQSSGGSAAIYLWDDKRGGDKAALKKKLKPLLAQLPGVDRVLDVADFKKHGLPDPQDNPEQADLMISARPGFAFSNDHKSTALVVPTPGRRGAHGHLPNQAYMHATFIAVGAGIKPGTVLKEIRSIDVAPTIAELMGVELPTADGRVLKEILQTEKR